jgi:hypothetical protein
MAHLLAVKSSRSFFRSSALNRSVVLALGLILATFVLTASPLVAASAAPVDGTVEQCNDIAGVDGGTGAVECSVTIDNYLDLATGATSSTTSTIVSVHAANTQVTLPAATVVTSTELIRSVNQCNDSVNVGGGNTICTVTVNNHITGSTTASPATVNQCIGSGESTELDCAPQGNTTDATVTQCNGSGNGGGADVFCRVGTSSTVTKEVPVTVNQCNGSSNGGGATVECSTRLTNNVVPAAVISTPTPTPTPTPTETALPANADTVTAAPELAATGVDSAPLLISVAAGALLLGLGALLALRRTVVRPVRQD